MKQLETFWFSYKMKVSSYLHYSDVMWPKCFKGGFFSLTAKIKLELMVSKI